MYTRRLKAVSIVLANNLPNVLKNTLSRSEEFQGASKAGTLIFQSNMRFVRIRYEL